MNILQALCATLLDVVFPKEACVLVSEQVTLQTLEHCAVRVFASTSFPCIAPFPYSHKKVTALIHALKYHGYTHAASKLGNALAPYLIEELSEKRQFGQYEYPVIIPIPLHNNRFEKRGYNQSELIARALFEALQDQRTTLVSQQLVRCKDTAPQAKSVEKHTRIANMQNAFSVPNKKEVAGKDIILLDDVVTTGATLGTAREALLRAGAREVLCVAVAH
jgi:ComF family protein